MSLPSSPKNDTQRYLAKIAGQDVSLPERPRTSTQRYLAKIAGQNVTLPDFPRTEEERYLQYIATHGGGGTITLQSKTATPTEQEQTIEADEGYDGLSAVTVDPIPSSYIIPSGSMSITENNTYDVTSKAQVVVNVESGADLSDLEIYVADFRTEPPTLTEGVCNVYHRTLVS